MLCAYKKDLVYDMLQYGYINPNSIKIKNTLSISKGVFFISIAFKQVIILINLIYKY